MGANSFDLKFGKEKQETTPAERHCQDRRGSSSFAKIVRGYIGSRGRVGALLDIVDSIENSKCSFKAQPAHDSFQKSDINLDPKVACQYY